VPVNCPGIFVLAQPNRAQATWGFNSEPAVITHEDHGVLFDALHPMSHEKKLKFNLTADLSAPPLEIPLWECFPKRTQERSVAWIFARTSVGPQYFCNSVVSY